MDKITNIQYLKSTDLYQYAVRCKNVLDEIYLFCLLLPPAKGLFVCLLRDKAEKSRPDLKALQVDQKEIDREIYNSLSSVELPHANEFTSH
jgi:hypothetical protein